MNRRSFLSMVGLAPVAAAVAARSAVAEPRLVFGEMTAGFTSRNTVIGMDSGEYFLSVTPSQLREYSVPPGFASSLPGVSVATVDCQPPTVATTLSVSDGVPRSSLPEMRPAATPALALSESASAATSLLSPQVVVADATNSTPSGAFDGVALVTAAGAASCGPAAISSDDPELDAIISALEAEWRADGIVMKATALRVATSSLIHASSASTGISKSISEARA